MMMVTKKTILVTIIFHYQYEFFNFLYPKVLNI